MADAIPRSRFLSIDETPQGAELAAAFVEAHPTANVTSGAGSSTLPIIDDGRTWVLSKQWGLNTVPTLDALLELAPGPGFSYHAAPTWLSSWAVM